MSDGERRFLVEKYGKLLQEVLVEIRNLTYQEGNAERINYLADLTHNLPEFLVGWHDRVLCYLRSGLIEYARKYYPSMGPEQSRYVMLLDMDEATFNELYHRPEWTEPLGTAD